MNKRPSPKSTHLYLSVNGAGLSGPVWGLATWPQVLVLPALWPGLVYMNSQGPFHWGGGNKEERQEMTPAFRVL